MSSLEHARGKPSFWLAATKDQARDTGMAMVLVCLIVYLVTREHRYVTVGALVLLVDMIAPTVFKPLAKLWFGLSHILGTVMSKVLLTVVFFLVLFPMGWFRRCCGKDAMRVRDFGRDQASAFRVRDHLFTPGDIEQPF
jgi:hypothetical protein